MENADMSNALTALEQELERIVETGRVRLPFIGNRPELADIIAKQWR